MRNTAYQDKSVSLGPNLFAMPMYQYEGLRADGEDLSAFRFTDDRKYALLQRDPKQALSEGEICKINLMCDKVEGAKNREVKASIMAAIRSHFNRNGNDFQLIEFGAGRHPLTPVARSSSAAEYHAIEIDSDIITELKTKGISASTIDTIGEGTLQADKTRIAAGIYTLHFWDPEKAADDIKRVVSQDGFFVANYMSSKKNLDPQHGENLLQSLREEGLSVSIVRQGVTKTSRHSRNHLRADENLGNEFWVVSYPPEKNGMKAEATRFAQSLVSHLPKPEGTWLQATNYDAVKDSDRSSRSSPQGPALL